ncbi:choice-of-anchor Q domain-containing protein [Thermostichus sp. MS-CIW-41]
MQLPSPAQTTIYVTTSTDAIAADDLCSLREAVIAANTDSAVDGCPAGSGADTIVLLEGRTYTLSKDDDGSGHQTDSGANNDDLDITSTITIQGNGATIQRDTSVKCDLNGSAAKGEFRIFHVSSGGKLNLQSVAIKGGCADGANSPDTAGGGVFVEVGSQLAVSEVQISSNRAFSFGGGIHNLGTVTINKADISGNSANQQGGGIHNGSGGKVNVTNAGITNNGAGKEGGGIYNGSGGKVTITNTGISKNGVGEKGGGIYNLGTVTIDAAGISDNGADQEGGGIYNGSGGKVTITNTGISNNGVGDKGGGIYNGSGGTITVTNAGIVNNGAGKEGGGIYNGSGGTVTVTNAGIVNNGAGKEGGGIYNLGTTNISKTGISGNNVSEKGGGIYNGNGGKVTLNASEISFNNASKIPFNNVNQEGGGIYVSSSSTVNITNSTLSGNSAGTKGGGIYNLGTSSLSFVTIASNSASEGGGIFNGATANLRNSIVANSTSGGNCSNAGTLTPSGANLDTDGSCPGLTAVTSAALNLGPLANNGGPTQTHALLAGSVAIDAVPAGQCTDLNSSPVNQDQRGFSRPAGVRCDVGAYEEQAPPTPTPTPTPTLTPTPTPTPTPSPAPPPGEGIRLVKRITALNGTPIPEFFDEPTDPNDNPGIPWPGGASTFLQGAINLPVRPGARVQYAIYFLLDSPASTFVVCDPLAPGLQYVPGSLSVSTGGGGSFIPPGGAVPPACGGISNPNGVVVVNVGGGSSGSAGVIRFEVTVPR